MTNAAKKQSIENGQRYLADCLLDVENAMVHQLERDRRSQTHAGSLGEASEGEWRKLLRCYLPSRYEIEEAFVIDSTGMTSDQIDVVIFDATFTSPLHGHDHKKYLPRESVYAAFEVKQSVDKENLEYAGKKAASIKQLHCTSAEMVNSGRTISAREIFEPLTGLLAYDGSGWVNGLNSPSFVDNLPTYPEQRLDLVITAKSGFYDGRANREPSLHTGEGSMMRGVFRLLQALQELGTVPAIDWSLYERVLDSI